MLQGRTGVAGPVKRVLPLLVAIPAIVPGCDRGPREASTSDPETVRVPEPTGVTFEVSEHLRIGAVAGGGPEDFGNVVGLGLGPRGNLFVADVHAKEVRAFDPTGKPVWRAGREGRGPGEFAYLSGLAVGKDGVVWAMDPRAGRLTALDPRGWLLTTHPRHLPGFLTLPWLGTFDRSCNQPLPLAAKAPLAPNTPAP